MKKNIILNTFQLLFNLAIIACTVLGVLFALKGTIDTKTFYSLSFIAVAVCTLSSLCMVFSNIVSIHKGEDVTPRLFFNLSFISAILSGVSIILILYLCIYAKSDTLQTYLNLQNGNMFFTIIIPAISIVNFMFFEIVPTTKFNKILVPTGAFLFYILVIFAIMISKNFMVDSASAKDFAPYEFFKVIPEWSDDYLQNIFVLLASIASAFILSVVLWCVNRLLNRIIIGVSLEEYTGETDEDEELRVQYNENDSTGTKLKKYISAKVSFKSNAGGRIYHISYHDRKAKTWKVKGEGAERATKVFPNQQEAINYAKALVAKNGGSIRIHSMHGKMRKDFVWNDGTSSPVIPTNKVNEKPTVNKVESKPIVKKEEVKPVEKKVEVKPIEKKVESKPIVKKEEVKPVEKKVVSKKSTDKKATSKAKTSVKSKTATKKVAKKPAVKKASKPATKKVSKPASKKATTKVAKKPAVKKASKTTSKKKSKK